MQCCWRIETAGALDADSRPASACYAADPCISQLTLLGNAILPIMFAFGVIGLDLRKRTADMPSTELRLHTSTG